jgi:hypothetical protein
MSLYLPVQDCFRPKISKTQKTEEQKTIVGWARAKAFCPSVQIAMATRCFAHPTSNTLSRLK